MLEQVTLTQLNLDNQPRIQDVRVLQQGLERVAPLTQLKLDTTGLRRMREIQIMACKQLQRARVMLYKMQSIEPKGNVFSSLPLEIREKMIASSAEEGVLSDEQQRLIQKYAQGEITPVADKLKFFAATKCDRIMVNSPYKPIDTEALRQALASLNT